MDWTIGVEVELVAPPGLTRRDLAVAIARHRGGRVRPFFHPQLEPSKVPGQPLFHNLTLGYEVLVDRGQWVAQCVDDITLQQDLDKRAAPRSGWYRIVSDDPRLLQLIMRQADPEATLEAVLWPIARLFGTLPQPGPNQMQRVVDQAGQSIAIAVPLPGERERPCELITPPIASDHLARLESLLAIARGLGFSAAHEGATHLHFDAERLRSARILRTLAQILDRFGPALRDRLETNPHCRRLGTWPEEALALMQTDAFASWPWPKARAALGRFDFTKYCDFNIKNMLGDSPTKDTFEVRILPVWLTAEPILRAARLMACLLDWAVSAPATTPIPCQLADFRCPEAASPETDGRAPDPDSAVAIR